MNLHDWAIKWGVSLDAFRDLQTVLAPTRPRCLRHRPTTASPKRSCNPWCELRQAARA